MGTSMTCSGMSPGIGTASGPFGCASEWAMISFARAFSAAPMARMRRPTRGPMGMPLSICGQKCPFVTR